MKWLVILMLLGGCSSQTAIYVSSRPSEGTSSLSLPRSLPADDFVAELTDATGVNVEVEFEIVPMEAATCYWSRLLSICTGDGTSIATSERGPEGLNVTVKPGDRVSEEYTYFVFGQDNGSADYTIVREGRVIAFGVKDLGSGKEYSRYQLID